MTSRIIVSPVKKMSHASDLDNPGPLLITAPLWPSFYMVMSDNVSEEPS